MSVVNPDVLGPAQVIGRLLASVSLNRSAHKHPCRFFCDAAPSEDLFTVTSVIIKGYHHGISRIQELFQLTKSL